MVVDGTIVHCGSGGRGCLIGVSSFMLRKYGRPAGRVMFMWMDGWRGGRAGWSAPRHIVVGR